MVTCSTPASRKYGQRRSGSCAAAKYVPSETLGSTRLAANATAKWPMNMASRIFRRRRGGGKYERREQETRLTPSVAGLPSMRLADLLLLRGRLPDEVAEPGERARHAQRTLADQLLRAVADGAEQALDRKRGQAGVEAHPRVAAAGLGHVEGAVGDADHLLPAEG